MFVHNHYYSNNHPIIKHQRSKLKIWSKKSYRHNSHSQTNQTFSQIFCKIIRLIEKYNIKWIYLPDELRVYGIEDLIYARNSDCFIQRGNFYEVVC